MQKGERVGHQVGGGDRGAGRDSGAGARVPGKGREAVSLWGVTRTLQVGKRTEHTERSTVWSDTLL